MAEEFLPGLSRAWVTFLVLVAKAATSEAARAQVAEGEWSFEVRPAAAVLKLEVVQALPIICEFGLRLILPARAGLA